MKRLTHILLMLCILSLFLAACEVKAPLPWPMDSPSDEQVKEARSCKVDVLAAERYPENLSSEELETAYPVQSPCDWAVLAVAYFDHNKNEDTIPEEGKRAFIQAVALNPALAFKKPLFYYYFNSLDLVVTPPFANQPITSLTIDYQFAGMRSDSQVSYSIAISQAHLSEQEITISIQAQPEEKASQAAEHIDPTVIQAIGPALANLLPTRAPVTLNMCTDTFPEWLVTLTFLDGTHLTLNTYRSNMLLSGGPWQVEIEGQYYMQYSTALLKAFLDLFEALNIQPGSSSAFCRWVEIFGVAYP